MSLLLALAVGGAGGSATGSFASAWSVRNAATAAASGAWSLSNLAAAGFSAAWSINSEVSASPGAGGDYGPAKRRYVRKIGSRLVTFSSARAAVAAIDVSPAPAANSDPVAPDEAVKTVKVSEVKRIAASYAAEDKIMELFNRAQYEAIMMMVEDWQRDEEDVELLLMSV